MQKIEVLEQSSIAKVYAKSSYSKLKRLDSEQNLGREEEVFSQRNFDNVAIAEDINVLVTMADFRKAQSELVPSVSVEELEHNLRVKQNLEGKKIKQAEEVGSVSETG